LAAGWFSNKGSLDGCVRAFLWLYVLRKYAFVQKTFLLTAILTWMLHHSWQLTH